jgi:hypothetical protein
VIQKLGKNKFPEKIAKLVKLAFPSAEGNYAG